MATIEKKNLSFFFLTEVIITLYQNLYHCNLLFHNRLQQNWCNYFLSETLQEPKYVYLLDFFLGLT
jgi:hypothetical protein